MKLSSMVLAASMALGSGASFAAGGPIDLSTGSASFGGTPTSIGFTDMYTFTLSTASIVTSSITTIISGPQDVDFSSITLTGPSGVFAFTQLLADPLPETWALTSPTLMAGAYTLTLIGTNSPAMGSYGGNIGVSPIPEPESMALLLAGLGVVGFVARRRQTSH